MSEASLSTILEAILFGAGRSMSAEELSELLEKPQGEVQSALRDLQATIRRRRDSALQLADVAGRSSADGPVAVGRYARAESVRPCSRPR